MTGAAGFIGCNLVLRLFRDVREIKIIGIDNMNDYYDVNIKKERLATIQSLGRDFVFIQGNIADKACIDSLFTEYKPSVVVNLAAQAGVRYSIDNPDIYIKSNIIGFYNLLEACRYNKIDHLLYASSSSVYGDNNKTPFSEDDKTDSPVSLYAATKKCDELLAYSYSKLYDINITGLRFFTVYGPCGRPDMAYFDFTNKLINDKKIKLFNYGNCKRDFTYIEDAIECIIRIIDKGTNQSIKHIVYNIGNSNPVDLLEFVNILKEELVRIKVIDKNFDLESHIEYIRMQNGDVVNTYADTKALEKEINYRPNTTIRKGIRSFVKWYKEYYLINEK